MMVESSPNSVIYNFLFIIFIRIRLLIATKVVKIIENTYLSGVFFYVCALKSSTFRRIGVIFGCYLPAFLLFSVCCFATGYF